MPKQNKRPPRSGDLTDFLAPEGDLKEGIDTVMVRKAKSRQPAANASAISVVAIETRGAASQQTVFRLDEDTLVLSLRIKAGERADKSSTYFDANFQILEYATNIVAADCWSRNFTMQYGTEFSVCQGSTAPAGAPGATPPAAWGLRCGLYIFRALIEVPATHTLIQAAETALFRVR